MNYDVLVIGTGLAGLSTAIECAEAGLNVCILTKEKDAKETNTKYAQGGIVGKGSTHEPDLLASDILHAAHGIAFKEGVKKLALDGPQQVEDFLIDHIGVEFCKDSSGEYDYTKEAAHSVRRILHVKDTSGAAIMDKLLEYALSLSNIHFLYQHSGVDIITNTHHSINPEERYHKTRALGAYVLNQQTGKIKPIFANNTVIATGGMGNLFLHTSNPSGATGDGIAMAYRTGAAILNAEYIQFHPTVLFHRDVKRFLITEAMRGEGGKLVNTRGEAFMSKYSPELLELAPRDEVARAIYKEMEATDSEYVFLDVSSVSKVDVKTRFPVIYEKCLSVGIDITSEPIPVVPAAHYYCGGIKVDLHGQTSIPGLMAVGECACTGVHGANRLASVSLLEAVYFAHRASTYIQKNNKPLKQDVLDNIPQWIYPAREEEFDSILIKNDLHQIKSTLWNYVGIIRSNKRLTRAAADLDYMGHRIERFYKSARLNREMLELRNAVVLANVITKSALSNKQSIGCHYREN